MSNQDHTEDATLLGRATPRSGGAGRRYHISISSMSAKALRVAGVAECGRHDLRLLRVEENGLELDEEGVAELLHLTYQSLLPADATYLDAYAEALWSDGETFLSNLPVKHRQIALHRFRAFLGWPTSGDRKEKK